MLIKEYRIALPMSVEEYRIAQLYMIQKKSREESHGEGSGVEIIVNEPYTDGPGGNGQYTYKIYHIGSHLPGWFRAILPKSALRVEEEAWNAYPYTKTRYKCPFVEKFLLEVETKYVNDPGYQDNVFNLPGTEMKHRQVDFLDFVKDPLSSGDYRKEEDPKCFKSSKTGRGPLSENWWKEYAETVKDPSKGRAIMTSYKLCRVEFRYWGMQNKIERFIHEIGLRKTMLRAHRQAWCWQDEWYGLKLSDIRRLERETQLALAEKMGNTSDTELDNTDNDMEEHKNNTTQNVHEKELRIPISKSCEHMSAQKQNSTSRQLSPVGSSHRHSFTSSKKSMGGSARDVSTSRIFESLEQLIESSSDEEFFDAKDTLGYKKSSDNESSSSYDSASQSSDDDAGEHTSLLHSSSLEVLGGNDEFADAVSVLSDTVDLKDKESPLERRLEQFRQQYSLEQGPPPVKELSPPTTATCRTNILFLVLHGGSILETSSEQASKRSDFSTLKSTFDRVIRTTYPAAIKQIAFRLVPCPVICSETLNILSSLSPTICESQTPVLGDNGQGYTQEFVPLGAISLFSSSSPDYQEFVNKMVAKANLVYHDFLLSEEGKGFNGNVCLIADSTGSLLAYDALSQTNSGLSRGSQYDSHGSLIEQDYLKREQARISSKGNLESTANLSHSDPELRDSESTDIVSSEKQLSKSDIIQLDSRLKPQGSVRQSSGSVYLNVNDGTQGPYRRTSSGSNYDGSYMKFEFDVSDVFMLGSPLGLILAYRRMYSSEDKSCAPISPACQQVYNLFHSSDPIAARLEPLIHNSFRHIPPVKVARYNKFPVGDGEPIHVVETVQSNMEVFTGLRRCSVGFSLQRQGSVSSVASQISGLGETTVTTITSVTSRWWGNKRVDFSLYCPEVLNTFPSTSFLPHLFHASFWESSDVVSFILRQVLRHDILFVELSESETDPHGIVKDAKPVQKEKWQKRRTTIKVKNLQANHRGNDVIVCEGHPQMLAARFMYGSFDVTSLTGEKVDVHVMDQSAGEWKYLGTSVTDKHGKLMFTIPEDKHLHQGMHPVKTVVRGDHTSAEFFLTVLPPKTEMVVFSIDGSFTASMSISGKDPKVRAGAVDVVRLYQDLGYLILYVTARPDMQHRKVVSWLAMHNFPHGMVAFMDGLSKEPLKQKVSYLRGLQHEAKVIFSAAYGSSKDIYVYKEIGLTPQQIFIVGKASKKQMMQSQVLVDGYAAHLKDLMMPGAMKASTGAARKFIRQGCMNKSTTKESKKQLKRLASNPTSEKGDYSKQMDVDISHTRITVSEHGNTILEPSSEDFGASNRSLRGSSPRPKMPVCDSSR